MEVGVDVVQGFVAAGGEHGVFGGGECAVGLSFLIVVVEVVVLRGVGGVLLEICVGSAGGQHGFFPSSSSWWWLPEGGG